MDIIHLQVIKMSFILMQKNHYEWSVIIWFTDTTLSACNLTDFGVFPYICSTCWSLRVTVRIDVIHIHSCIIHSFIHCCTNTTYPKWVILKCFNCNIWIKACGCFHNLQVRFQLCLLPTNKVFGQERKQEVFITLCPPSSFGWPWMSCWV